MLTAVFTTGDHYGPAPSDEWHAYGHEEWHESGSYDREPRVVHAVAAAPVAATHPAQHRCRPVPVARRPRTGFSLVDARLAGGRRPVRGTTDASSIAPGGGHRAPGQGASVPPSRAGGTGSGPPLARRGYAPAPRQAARSWVCCHIRSVDLEIRALILTSYDDDEALSATIEAGAAGYILKQIRGNDLVDTVRRAADGQSLLDPAVTQRVLELVRRRPEEPRELRNLTDRERRIRAAPLRRDAQRGGHQQDTAGEQRQRRGECSGEVGLAPRTALPILPRRTRRHYEWPWLSLQSRRRPTCGNAATPASAGQP